MSQLALPMAWAGRGAGGGGDAPLLLCEENMPALAILRDWRRWPGPCALLVGPRHSGRSALGRLFAQESGGTLIDDADKEDEERLFHAWNVAQESRVPLLLVTPAAPPAWAIALPDLRTRLATAAVARIAPPGEGLIAALVAQGLAHAGAAFAPDLPDYIARRLERCYAAVHRAVERMNVASLASSRKISVLSAAKILGEAGLIAADRS